MTLRERSKLYRTLDDMYKSKTDEDISEDFYNECIDAVLEFSKREIKYLLFELKLSNKEVDSSVECVDTLLNGLKKLLELLTLKNIKNAFFVDILEVALEEK